MSKNIHLMGIGGSGLSAIARLLVECGYAVSGCDQVPSPITESLKHLGVRVDIGHEPGHITGMDVIIQSSAVKDDNPEIARASELGIPVIKRSEFFQTFLAEKKTIAVAGTHGKTTTTAMIAWLLTCLGIDPGYLIGGISKNLKNNAHASSSDLFVIEADEYDHMFLGLNPAIILLTNLDYDHPDFFITQESYDAAFEKFVKHLQPEGILLLEHENTKAFSVLEALPENATFFTYGMSGESKYQAVNLRSTSLGGFQFDMVINRPVNPGRITDIEIIIAGEHNVRNALGALAVIHQSGFDISLAAKHLKEFTGTERRFDLLGEFNGICLVDDYAHHPTEINTTLQAARLRYPDNRIIVVWQPHTFTRSKTFFEQFTTAFSEVDEVIITEVYAARESDPDFSASLLASNLKHKNVRFMAEINTIKTFLIDHLKKGDVLLVLSAGDAVEINAFLKEYYSHATCASYNDAYSIEKNEFHAGKC